MSEKQCSKCGKLKPYDCFYVKRPQSNERTARCKECLCEAGRAKTAYHAPERWNPGTIPKIGDKVSAKKLGMSNDSLMVWVKCPDCENERWVRVSSYIAGRHIHCRSCSKYGARSAQWKGGLRYITANGYIRVWLPKSSPYIAMAARNRKGVMEHRLIMAKHLGRCLDAEEIVHHINGIRTDNRIENLELISCKGRHNTHSNYVNADLIAEVKKLSNMIKLRDQEIAVLRNEANNKRTT